MKNKKGFAISGLLYPILILTLFLVVQILMMMQSRKNVLDKTRTELADGVNAANTVYNNEELSTLISEQQKKIDNLEKQMSEVGGKVYPVGSIYISYNNTNPSKIFGGTWVAYGTGRTLVGVDTSQTEFNTVGKTGGEKTHTLTVNEMPSHSHEAVSTSGSNRDIKLYPFQMIQSGSNMADVNVIRPTGGNQPHNNLQPYITVYMWRRTA